MLFWIALDLIKLVGNVCVKLYKDYKNQEKELWEKVEEQWEHYKEFNVTLIY